MLVMEYMIRPIDTNIRALFILAKIVAQSCQPPTYLHPRIRLHVDDCRGGCEGEEGEVDAAGRRRVGWCGMTEDRPRGLV